MKYKVNDQVVRNRACDRTSQICGLFVFGLCCFPCATTRLISHYTGCIDPMRVRFLGEERVLPGLKLISTP